MKKVFAKIVLISAVFVLTLSIVGCSFLNPKDKVFSKEGMSITLNESFYESDIITQTAYYASLEAIVTALKEDGSIIGDCTVTEYAEMICEVNKFDPDSVVTKDGYAEFTYEKELNGKEFYYYARCLHDGKDFWLFQFACETKNTEKYTPLFEKWASSISFENDYSKI